MFLVFGRKDFFLKKEAKTFCAWRWHAEARAFQAGWAAVTRACIKRISAVLSALFEKDFERYFALAGGGEPLWLFVHVPKTAGSSLTSEVEAILHPSQNINIDHTDTTRSYQARFDDAVETFITRHAETPHRFATGHINLRQVEMIRGKIADLRCFSMLRNPIARLISDYHYQRSSMNTAQAHFIDTTPSLKAYVARKHVHNKIALHLAPRPMVMAGDVGACVDYIMRHYAFVGLQEMFPLSLRTLTTLMGSPRAPQARVRVNKEISDKTLAADMEQQLRELNAVDIGIFQAFQSRWRPIRDDLRAYLSRQGT
jgi:hypothetical protein